MKTQNKNYFHNNQAYIRIDGNAIHTVSSLAFMNKQDRAWNTITLEQALLNDRYKSVRPYYSHTIEYLCKAIDFDALFPSYQIELSYGCKGRKNAVILDPVQSCLRNKRIRFVISLIQISYSKLSTLTQVFEAYSKFLLEGVTVNDKLKRGFLKFPSGIKSNKTQDRILTQLGISEYTGLDPAVAVLAKYKCDKCGSVMTRCNLVKPDKSPECYKTDCSGTMIGERINQHNTWRDSNHNKHWGVTPEAVANGLNPNDPMVMYVKGGLKDIYSELAGIDFSNLEARLGEDGKAIQAQASFRNPTEDKEANIKVLSFIECMNSIAEDFILDNDLDPITKLKTKKSSLSKYLSVIGVEHKEGLRLNELKTLVVDYHQGIANNG